MKRLYYLADNLNTADEVAKALHDEGISDWNFHVLSKDEAGLYTHHLHAANPLHQRDLIRTGERGALLGFLAGMAAALFSAVLLELSSVHSVMVFAIAIVLPTLFGAWLGGLVGLSTENHKIARFHDDIEYGRALLMIDVKPAHEMRVRELMQLFSVREGGEDTTLILPFRFSHA
ncbi:MAG: hypothetical protein QM709_14610 [Spongiibacteraceae bacterium]